MVEITATEQNIKKNKSEKKWRQPRDLWDNIRHINISVVPEGGEREQGPEKICDELTAENVPHMGKEIVSQVQGAQRYQAG